MPTLPTVQALTVEPGTPGSARIDQVPRPDVGDGEVEIECLLVGVCGTDAEIIKGAYGTAPAGEDRLVLGHEAVGRVVATGELVVPIVRHPDPVPCSSCAVGEWDMCRNGRYTEHGIKERHGFAREVFTAPADRLVRVPDELGLMAVLVEPASVVAKAWEQIDRISARASWSADTALGGTYHAGRIEDVGPVPDVNANRRHYEAAVEALAAADPGWLERLVTRRVPLESWPDALRREHDDVKVVLDLSA